MQKVKNTAPLTIGEAPNQMRLTRRFLGNHNPTNTIEKKELQSYVKGGDKYQYKGNTFEVRQEYFYEPATN